MYDQKIINITEVLNSADPQELELLNERIDIIRHKLKFLDNKTTVLCIQSLEPLQPAGGLVNEMLQIAGGASVLNSGSLVTWDDILSADPDILVLMPEGFTLDRSLTEIGQLLAQPDFADLKAIKNNRLYIADGSRYFYQPGAGVVDSIEILAEIINPKQFIFGYEGDGWMKFSI